MNHTLKRLVFLLGFAVAVMVPAQASDLIDALVKKGYLSAAEAKELVEPDVRVSAKGEKTKSIRFNGRLQTHFQALSTDYSGGGAGVASGLNGTTEGVNDFLLRRMYFGVKAGLGNGLTATVNMDLASEDETSGAGVLEKAIISWEAHDYLNIHLGYKKVPLNWEETMSSADIKTIELSLAARYITNDIDMAARHTGIFLDGDLGSIDDHVGKLYYSAALVNSDQNQYASGGSNNTGTAADGDENSPALFARMGVEGDAWKGLKYNLGADFGVKTDDGRNLNNAATSGDSGGEDTIYGFYGDFDYNNLNFMSEVFFGKLANRKLNGGDSNIFAYTLMPSYRWQDIELIFSFSRVSVEGSPIDISTTSPYTAQGAANDTLGNDFREATQYYIGANWYILGNDVKLSGGYEHTNYDASIRAAGTNLEANVDGARLRLQLLF